MPVINIGDIYWLNSAGGISHPHVVIAIQTDTLTVCALTTNANKKNRPGNVILEASEGSLDKQSIVEVSKVKQILHSELEEYVGSLSALRVEEIIRGIGFLERTYAKRCVHD